jgi:hypothetical protein
MSPYGGGFGVGRGSDPLVDGPVMGLGRQNVGCVCDSGVRREDNRISDLGLGGSRMTRPFPGN